ncbi:hypothetical protein N7492_000209 [Penicillium capsulatum]|uniref:Zn(2)-C6 fungal-type domain-containing protein n=1 Tax=Penicillium capsulatum TaxID=69766 RepID=A0A9W9IP32_9EURO|nr:hypothetical protein N7492_000209 [Penicillium capsulatum]KAJ6130726.1 hypothetical protein N7512_003506 [Penicillium capsulatum]
MSDSEPKRVKTCQNCVRAKIRCIRTTGSSCDRCHRLNKECYFRPTRSRYNPIKKDSRMEALEAKVEQLIARSGNFGHPSSSTHYSLSPITPGSDHPSDSALQDVVGRGIISFQEADSLLDTYRRTLIQYFPFVVLSEDMTLSRMREERPILLIAILMVASSNRSGHNKVLEGLFKEAIAECIFTHSQSLDVLQALLVAQAWIQHRSDWLLSSTYLHLARGIIGDLQFDKLSDTRTLRSRITVNEGVCRADEGSSSLINEKKRAVIGCLMLFSCRSTILQKNHAKTRLPYVDQYAKELREASEYPTDAWLVHIVRLQDIMERVDEAVATVDTSDAGLVIQAFHTEIDAYKAGLPNSMHDNIIVQIHLYTLELFVCQAFLFDKSSLIPFPVLSSNPQALETGPLRQSRGHVALNLTPSQTNLLGRGLAAAKGVLDFFLAQSPQMDGRLSYMQWLQSGSDIVLACKLAVTASNYASQNAHIKNLCSTLDMPTILRGMLGRVHGLTINHEESTGKTSSTSFYVQWIGRIHTWFEQRYQSSHLEQPDTGEVMSGGNTSPAPYLRSESSSWDTAPAYDGYSGNMAPNSGIGEWPDFIWNVTMEDIINGPTNYLNMPFNMNDTGM